MFRKFVDYLVREGVIAEQQADVQLFALTFLIQTILAHGLIFLLAVIFGVLPETIIFEAIFLPLRSYAGGFHASTQLRCLILSVAVWGIIMFGSRSLPSWSCFVIAVVAGAIIWKIAPIPHANNPLSSKRFAEVKRITRILLIITMAFILINYIWWKPEFSLIASLTLLSTAISLEVVKKK